MSTTNCDDCPGGDNLVFEVNPDPAISVIVRVDNRVIIPARLNPGDICFNELRNVEEDTLTTGLNCEVRPLVWNPTNCCVEYYEPPCPLIVDYDPALMSFPDPVDICTHPIGTTTFYGRSIVTGLITHVWDCLTMVWVELGGVGGGGGGGGGACFTEDVCYDLSGWGFPADYDMVGASWLVQAVNQITEICPGGPASCCPPELEVSFDYVSSSGTGPPDWGALTWSTGFPGDPAFTCPAGEVRHNNTYPPFVDKAAFRMPICAPPGQGGPIDVTMDYIDIFANSHMSFALWDSVSGDTQPIISSNVGAHSFGPEGPIVRVFSGSIASPPFGMTFSFGLNAGVDPSNCYFIMWNIGSGFPPGTGPEDAMDNFNISYTAAAGTCCFSWSGVSDVANYLNTHDPNGPGWTVQPGDIICKTVTQGIGAQYGDLDACADSATPTVTPCVP